MKRVVFLGDSRARIRAFPETARRNAGTALLEVQQGNEPKDSKSMVDVAPGVQEIRVWDQTGTYRVVYVARLAEAIFVLHAFQKKSQQTLQRDIDLIRKRYEEANRRR